jgi:hypothetical protein
MNMAMQMMLALVPDLSKTSKYNSRNCTSSTNTQDFNLRLWITLDPWQSPQQQKTEHATRTN